MPRLADRLRPLARRLRRGRPRERVLIVGTSPLAHRVVEAVESDGRPRRPVVLGIVGEATADLPPGLPLLGPLSRLDRVVALARPDRIVVAQADRRDKLPVHQLLEARLRGVAVEEATDFYERMTGKLAIEALTPSSIIFGCGFRPSRVTRVATRALSLGVALLGAVAGAPLMALVALAVRLDSPGPVFFVQERVGRAGRPFRLIKFRTMHVAASTRSEWVRDNRHRITRVGRWLRAVRLDELPQFINVLRGDMDVVGPRPHPASNFSLFVTVMRNSPECGQQIPYYSLRSMVRPGITGWAQVQYRYANDLEEEIEKMRYDLYYVKHRSFWLDLRILVETVMTVLAGRGAAEAEERAGTWVPALPAPAPLTAERRRAA